MAISARVRALTKRPSILKARAQGTIFNIISVMDKHLDDSIKRLQQYPPPRPESKYVRTGDLGRAWNRTDVKLTSDGLVGRIQNDVVDPYGSHYAVIVHGDEQGVGQLPLHRSTGWPLVAEVLRARDYQQRIKQVVHEALHD